MEDERGEYCDEISEVLFQILKLYGQNGSRSKTNLQEDKAKDM